MPSSLRRPGLLVVLLLLASLAAPSRGDDDAYSASACRWRPYTCGGVDISYPFYLASDTRAVPGYLDGESYCGYPGLAVTCEGGGGGRAVLKLGEDRYAVSRIDYANLTVSLADADAAAVPADGCPSVDHNVTIPPDVRLFLPISALDYLFLFANCSFGRPDADAAPPKPPSIKPITCGGADKVPGDEGLSFVLPSGDVPPGDWSGACRRVLEVPVLRGAVPRDAQDPRWRSDGYGKALRAGFQLAWDRSSGGCGRCEQSGGRCGFARGGEFLGCLCANGRMGGAGGCGKTLADSSSLGT